MATTKWILDPSHSELLFKVKHLMISTVTGSFDEISATATCENEDFENAQINFSAKTASVNTRNEQRDAHLRSGDFFDTDNHPELLFESTSFEKSGDEYNLKGNLSIKGISNPVSLNVEFAGMQKDPWGNTKAGFSINGKINRKDWNLNWNAPLETGGFLLSDEIKIQGEIQMTKDA